jgi:hypothetical protein
VWVVAAGVAVWADGEELGAGGDDWPLAGVGDEVGVGDVLGVCVGAGDVEVGVGVADGE